MAFGAAVAALSLDQRVAPLEKLHRNLSQKRCDIENILVMATGMARAADAAAATAPPTPPRAAHQIHLTYYLRCT